ncbi:adenosylcobinamide-GDP ribazoletransferase [Megasphaera sp. ASD88]|uniref:adenosylcobinamide-GDP ribazoletransferase n=1 Tax=Megasphaera TaxID=906 RepID=UPI000BAB334B|nr:MULTISPECIES: adenosylcobinamide-GDP ribazoletransferase [Megasphaera]MBM6731889.1 adenosylcobinamide-GDP ribazoletransferase [Megasphaera stantonii]PAV39593.1 adenosylcobinamide-GDP ribazoletransferase [Megasphaera sp. ASD88]
MKSFFIALQFLSRIHVVTQTVWTEADFGRSVIFFPLVGTVIGAVLCLAYVGISLWFSQPYMAVLLVLCWLLVTGGLHADGLMDTADGLFSGRSRERMLEILKDSCVGSNGVVAFVSCMALKVCFLANLPQQSVCAALLAVPTAARFGVLIGIFQFPYARQQGLGQSFVQYAPRRALVKAFLCALPPLAVAGWGYFLLLGAVMLISLGLNTYIARRLGGVTGDTYGAVIELSEMLLLGLAFLASGAVQTACIWI